MVLKRPWRVSFVTRLTFTMVLVAAGFGSGVAIFVWPYVHRALEREWIDKGHSIARHLAERSLELLATERWLDLQLAVESVPRTEPDVAYALVLDASGEILVHTFHGGLPVGLREANRWVPGEPSHTQWVATEEGVRRDLALPILDGSAGSVRVGLREERLHRHLHRTRRWLVGSLVAFVALSAGATWLLARRLTRPMAQLAGAAERIGAGDLDPLLPAAGPDEIGQLTATFRQMVTGLRQSRQELEQKTAHLERQARDLLTLHAVSATASRSLHLEEILETVLEEVLARFRLKAGWVFVDANGSSALELRAHRGLSAEFVAFEQSGQGPCPCQEALSRQRPARLSERPHCPRGTSVGMAQEGLRAHVCVPLVAKERVRGLLHLAGETPDHFTEADLAVLTALGQQIGVALENAFLFAQAQREAAQFSALFEVSQALNSSTRLPEVLKLIAAKAAEVMGSDFCSLMLLEPETQQLQVQAVYGPGCHCQGGHPLHRCEAVAYRTVSERRTQIIRDFQDFSVQDPTFAEPCSRLAYLISVPLVAKERPIGVLNVGGVIPREVNPHELELLELFSHLASVSIENARLMITSVLLPEVHHRVKNNLQDIASLLSLQQRRLHSPEGQAALRDTINRIKGLALVHDLMSRSGPGPMDLTALAREIKTRMVQPLVAPEQTLTIDVEGEPLMLPNRLVQAAALVLNELASNALKHAFRGRDQGHLRIVVREGDSQVELTVQDDGPGLPANVLAGHHRGLGLTIVETLVQRDLNGRLEWQNKPGATVRVLFPKTPLGPWPELDLR